ncbi:MAG: (2Fe-2S)-binding protein [bacterium]
MTGSYRIIVNGKQVDISCPPGRTLLDIIREDLGLTGAKRGCGIGACGACTVLIDGKPRRSCRIKIGEIAHDSPHITTIEGLEQDGKLHPIQQAFIDCGAIQCGFCTPGMVLAAKALLDSNPDPTREEIRTALSANLCRCTGYQQIFQAVEKAARLLK